MAGIMIRAIAFLIGIVASPLVFAAEPAPPLRVGVATADITPPVGYRMSGYFRERVSTAVHDPLHAKAIVFAQGNVKAAIVICDVVGVPASVSDVARKGIARAIGTEVGNVIVCGTHTHTGPLYYGAMCAMLHEQAMAREGHDPCEPIDYKAFLGGQVKKAAVAANGNLRAVQVRAGIARQEQTISFNRRYRMRDGSVKMCPAEKMNRADIVEPAGPIDPDVGMLICCDPASGKPFAGLTVFAMHQDTTGGTEFSADYAYYLEQSLRETFGPDYTSIFGISTCGNINHCDPSVPIEQWRRAPQIGPILAATVRAAEPGLKPVVAADLRVERKTLDLPLQKYSPERIAQAREDVPKIGKDVLPFLKEVDAYKVVDLQSFKGTSVKLDVQAIRISKDVAIVALPSEMFVEFGLAIKQASPFKSTLVIELANDNCSYIPTKKAFAEGSYETVNSRLLPGGGEQIRDAAIELLKSLAK